MSAHTKQLQPRAFLITPPGQGGIGIICVRGHAAAQVVDAVFCGTRRCASQLRPGAIAHGTIRRDGAVVDEVLVARVRTEHGRGPRFEVNCHGGAAAVRAVLDCLREAGAEVNEWTETAGPAPDAPPLGEARIQRAAMAALPHAVTKLAAAMLLHQAEGALAETVRSIRDALAAGRELTAEVELARLLATADFGDALLNPPEVALLGPPNAGKSTLLNALLEEDRAIVHPRPGTTRDVVGELVSLRGVPFQLLDAAGIRRVEDEVEQQAVRRATALSNECDVALLVYDLKNGSESLSEVPAPEAARTLVVGNKLDLEPGGPAPSGLPPEVRPCKVVLLSAKQRTNLHLVEEWLVRPYRPFVDEARAGAPVVFEQAAQDALRRAKRALEGSCEAALEVLRAASAEE